MQQAQLVAAPQRRRFDAGKFARCTGQPRVLQTIGFVSQIRWKCSRPAVGGWLQGGSPAQPVLWFQKFKIIADR